MFSNKQCSNEHHYIGRAGEWHGVKYCGGGAGYVLSRALLRDWAPIINSCQRLPVGEDVSVGKVTTKSHFYLLLMND